MSFLPIVERELRVRGRAKGTYRGRMISALAATLFAALVLLGAEATSGASVVGGFLFETLGWVVFSFCLLQGARNTADCLSEEKRAGTLGLLFLTDLRGYDVVLGKLLATSLNSFYALLAVFPPLGIPIILGGVTVGEFWRMAAALIATLLFALTAGIFVSSISRDERRAWSGTMLLTGFFVVLVPLLQRVIPLPFSPTCAFLSWDDKTYTSHAGEFWTAIWSTLAMSVAFVVAASLILPRTWQERPESARRSAWLSRVAQHASPGKRARRRRLLEMNPVVWLATRTEHQTFLVWSLILSGSTAALLLLFLTGGIQMVSFSILILFILLHLVLSMWVASEACAVFPAARDSGALELLLSTPLTVREILEGHVSGMTRMFQRPLFGLLIAEAILLAAYLFVGARQGMAPQEFVFAILAVFLCLAAAITDLSAVARYGMWIGLIEKRTGWAVTRTILVVLLLPLGLMVITAGCGLILWPIVGVMKNQFFISRAQDKLNRNFRKIVTERFSAKSTPEPWADPLTTRRLKRAGESQLPPVLPRNP